MGVVGPRIQSATPTAVREGNFCFAAGSWHPLPWGSATPSGAGRYGAPAAPGPAPRPSSAPSGSSWYCAASHLREVGRGAAAGPARPPLLPVCTVLGGRERGRSAGGAARAGPPPHLSPSGAPGPPVTPGLPLPAPTPGAGSLQTRGPDPRAAPARPRLRTRSTPALQAGHAHCDCQQSGPGVPVTPSIPALAATAAHPALLRCPQNRTEHRGPRLPSPRRRHARRCPLSDLRERGTPGPLLSRPPASPAAVRQPLPALPDTLRPRARDCPSPPQPRGRSSPPRGPPTPAPSPGRASQPGPSSGALLFPRPSRAGWGPRQLEEKG